ncbi:Imm70 family immunity protein [Cohnella sp. GCM10012308]|uniref:Imm70 family immunity protein n=1 Tax=Cohnella sp. GCM10012308 TaxID=3317329 RepID=UPI0036068FC3
MAVGLMLGGHSWYQIGSGDFLHCFFSTVCYRLEANSWGSKYPLFMNKLYHEALEKEDNEKLLEEVKSIHKAFEDFSPDNVVWDVEDLSKQPPWGTNIDPSITSLANYFVTSNGVDLFFLFYSALNSAIQDDYDVKIISL